MPRYIIDIQIPKNHRSENHPMLKHLLIGILALTAALAAADPYSKAAPPLPRSSFDRRLASLWKQQAIAPANEAADFVMVRRATIDFCGRLPSPQETLAYLNSRSPDKQATLVNTLIGSDAYLNYWVMHFGDALRIKSEFAIKLWPDATFTYSRRIREFLQNNEPYDSFARALLLAQGSNFRQGAVNFFRAIPVKDATHIAAAAADFFLGLDFQKLPKEQQDGLAAVFDGIHYKETREWKEEIVYYVPADHDRDLAMPDGTRLRVPAGADARAAFCDWLTAPRNPFFAKAAVTHAWQWIFGQPPAPEIADFLARRFQRRFDFRALLREIATSTAYRVSCFTNDASPDALRLNAVYPIRRLDAEVIADAIAALTNQRYIYTSVIPEPFSYYGSGAVDLTDGSVTDSLLNLLGRPARDFGTPDERRSHITAKQRLYLYNSTDLFRRLWRIQYGRRNLAERVDWLYLLFLSRRATPEEHHVLVKPAKGKQPWRLVQQLPWILLNSSEFLHQH